jgi:hypothetical protein
MTFKGTAEAGKPPTKAVSTNETRPTNIKRKEALFSDEDSGDEIEIVGEIPASKARAAARPVQSRPRRAKRLS